VAKNSIGNLSVVISASTSGLSAALKRSQSEIVKFQSGVGRASASAVSALGGIGDAAKSALSPFSLLSGKPIADFTRGIGEAIKAAGSLADAGLNLVAVFPKMLSGLPIVGTAFGALGSAIGGVGSIIGAVSRAAGELVSWLGKVASEVVGVAGQIGVATAGIGAYAVKLAADAEQTQQSFSVMLGDATKASKLLGEVKGFAAETPFGSKELLDSTRQLIAYGTAAEQIIPTLRVLGDVGSATSTPLGDLVYLYGTLRAQGRAYTKDIQQFAGRGIPIYEELAKVLKVSTTQIQNLVEDGKVGFREVQMAFKSMTAEGSRHGGLMEKQSQTLAGLFESLKDNVVLSLEEIGKVLVEEFNLKGLLRDAIDFTKTIKDRVQGLRPLFREAADWAKAFANAFVVGVRSAWAAAEGFVTALEGAFSVGEKAGGLKDWLKGLQFDFKAARNVGISAAEGISLGLAKVVDFAEEVAHAIRKMKVELMRLDIMQFEVKAAFDPGGDPVAADEWRHMYKLQQEVQRRAEFFAKNRAELPRGQREINDAQSDPAFRKVVAGAIGKTDPQREKRLLALSAEIDRYQSSVGDLQRIVDKNPNNRSNAAFMKLIDDNAKLLEGSVKEYLASVSEVETRLRKAQPKNRLGELNDMRKELAEAEKLIAERGKAVGLNTQDVEKLFEGVWAKIGRMDLAREANGPIASLGEAFGLSAVASLQKQIEKTEFKIEKLKLSADQEQLAKQLQNAMRSPSQSMRKEMEDLRKLIDLRAFGTPSLSDSMGGAMPDRTNLSQLTTPLGIDFRRPGGEGVVGAELGRKFLDLEQSLGDLRPRLAGAFTKGSTQAASIEAQFSVAGQKQDPQARVEAVLRLIDQKSQRQVDELSKLGKALTEYLNRQGGNAGP
jgi:hypothetical protein